MPRSTGIRSPCSLATGGCCRCAAGAPRFHAGRLELLDPGRLPGTVLGYRRVHGAEEAHVFLNFSEREQPLDLSGLASRTLHSNLRDEIHPASSRCTLRAFEAVVLLADDHGRAA